jgi:hypothetical protein
MEIVEGNMYNCFHFLHDNTLLSHGKINFFFCEFGLYVLERWTYIIKGKMYSCSHFLLEKTFLSHGKIKFQIYVNLNHLL